MTDEQYKRLEAQFNEGILLGVQAATGKMIELLQLNPSWSISNGLTQATAQFKISARNMLAIRGLVPTSYDVIRGAEDVQLDFNIRIRQKKSNNVTIKR